MTGNQLNQVDIFLKYQIAREYHLNCNALLHNLLTAAIRVTQKWCGSSVSKLGTSVQDSDANANANSVTYKLEDRHQKESSRNPVVKFRNPAEKAIAAKPKRSEVSLLL